MPTPREFLADLARARAEEVVDTPGGFAVLSPRRYPHAHDHNALYVVGPVEPTALVAAADDVLAERPYRRIDHLAGEAPAALAAVLEAAGYTAETLVTMTATRPPDPDRPSPADVVELDVAQRLDIAERMWADDPVEAAVRTELAERVHSAMTAAQCTFLGVVGADGRAEASCDLFVRGDVAQIEEVSTLAPFRGRGHASRVVRAAVEHAAGVRTVFLLADADDWPRELYRRLGFEETDRHTAWSRVPRA